MTKRDIVIFLFKWKYSLLGYFLFIVTAVTILVYTLPQRYEAMATVLVESNRSPTMRSNPVLGVDELISLNSETAIILSRTVLGAAADNVGSGESNDPPTTVDLLIAAIKDWMIEVGLSAPMTDREQLIKTLQDNLDVEALPESNIINISIKGKSPKWVAGIVNGVTDSYIKHHFKIFSTAGTAEIYRRQTEWLKSDLERRKKALEAYKQQGAVSALSDTMRALVQRQLELSSELDKSSRELAELRTRFESGHTKIKLAEQNLASINTSIGETQSQLQALEREQAKIRDLEDGIAAADKSYHDYLRQYEEAKLNDLATTDAVNVRVVNYAEVPSRPDHSRIFFIALSIIGGAVLTFAIAFVREYFDHRVSDPVLVEQLLGVPVLGSIEQVGVTTALFSPKD